MSVEMVRDGRLGGYFNGGDRVAWCPTLWRRFVEKHQIRSVLDVGCGEGQSTQFFRDLGAKYWESRVPPRRFATAPSATPSPCTIFATGRFNQDVASI